MSCFGGVVSTPLGSQSVPPWWVGRWASGGGAPRVSAKHVCTHHLGFASEPYHQCSQNVTGGSRNLRGVCRTLRGLSRTRSWRTLFARSMNSLGLATFGLPLWVQQTSACPRGRTYREVYTYNSLPLGVCIVIIAQRCLSCRAVECPWSIHLNLAKEGNGVVQQGWGFVWWQEDTRTARAGDPLFPEAFVSQIPRLVAPTPRILG